MTKLAIFDLDGVLTSKTPDRFPACLFEGFLKSGDEVRFKGTNWIDELKKKGVDTGNRSDLEKISRRMYEFSKNQIFLREWAKQLIPELAGTKKLAILTNNSRLTVSSCLDGLDRYFSSIKTWENVSELKPSPEGILSICQELGIKPCEAIMVGDSREDSLAAGRAGAKAIILDAGESPQINWFD